MSMDHNLKLDPAMDQLMADLRERWVRARALNAAVGMAQTYVTSGEPSWGSEEILNQAEVFEDYIRDGKRAQI